MPTPSAPPPPPNNNNHNDEDAQSYASSTDSMRISLQALELEPDPDDDDDEDDDEHESFLNHRRHPNDENELNASEHYIKKRIKHVFSSAKGALLFHRKGKNISSNSNRGNKRSSFSNGFGGGGGVPQQQQQNSATHQQPKSFKFSTRNLLLLSILSISTFYLLQSEDTVVEQIEDTVLLSGDEESLVQNHRAHQNSFGGVQNVLHPAGAKAAAAAADYKKDVQYSNLYYIQTSIVPHAVPSLNVENLINHWGHYVHDEFRSPYASHLYANNNNNFSKKDLEEEQQLYEEKLKTVREEWGAWNFSDGYFDDRGGGERARPYVDFQQVLYRDVSIVDFPTNSWQMDQEYVQSFIKEARSLIHRVLEGIYAEYGFPSINKSNKTMLTQAEKRKRDELWQVHIQGITKNDPKKTGIASINKVGWDFIKRKLLHAMLTNNEFYYVLGGHSAAAGHGNDFLQSKAMEFHYIMEPIFDKLGMRLISRNMAQGGVGTTHSAMAGSHVYGEADIIQWDSNMTEKNPGAQDLFNKQAILSGERVPLLVDVNPVDIVRESNDTVGLATLMDVEDIAVTVDEKQADTLPFAVRYLKCDKTKRRRQEEDLCQKNENKYSAVCWVPRKDITPSIQQSEKPDKNQVSWHPGHVSHKYAARKLTVFVLHALNGALDLWEDGMEKDGFPLKESYWHIGDLYKNIRRSIYENINSHHWGPPPPPVVVVEEQKDGEEKDEQQQQQQQQLDPRSACEKTFTNYPRVCRVPMKGYTEWTPIAQTKHYLHSIVKHAPNGYYPHPTMQEVYSGINLQAYNQRVPYGEIDVHAIAIATTNSPLDLDHSWNYDDSYEGGEEKDSSSREDDSVKRLLWKEIQSDSIVSKEKVGGSKKKVQVPEHSIKRVALRSLSPMNNSTTPNAESIVSKRYNKRHLQKKKEEIIPGQGWVLGNGGQGWKTGFCDGSTMSTCARAEDNNCLYYGHNDGRGNIIGDQLSGWIVFDIPNVKYGIILFRLEWWIDDEYTERTKDWTEVNDGKTTDTTPYDSSLSAVSSEDNAAGTSTTSDKTNGNATTSGGRIRRLSLAESAFVDFAINGNVTTMSYSKFHEYTHETVKNFALWPVLDDKTMMQREWEEDEMGETIEVAMRIRSKEPSSLSISHIYYA